MPTLNSPVRALPHDRAIGIEIECLLPWKHHYQTLGHCGFFYAGADTSIDGEWSVSTGVEFVSQPLTQTWLKKEIGKLYKRFEISHNQSCGIHIHVNRGWCSRKRADRIASFLSTLTDEEMEDIFGRKPNGYCANIVDASRDRYVAVNRTNDHTIEFRSFRSGSKEWACYCVDLVCYLVKNVATLNINALEAFRNLYPKEM